jgi:hypothetical protein
MRKNSGGLANSVSARSCFAQDVARTGLAGAATSRDTEAVFQLLQIGNAQFGCLAYFPVGNRVAETNVHVVLTYSVVAMRIILIYIHLPVKPQLQRSQILYVVTDLIVAAA